MEDFGSFLHAQAPKNRNSITRLFRASTAASVSKARSSAT